MALTTGFAQKINGSKNGVIVYQLSTFSLLDISTVIQTSSAVCKVANVVAGSGVLNIRLIYRLHRRMCVCVITYLHPPLPGLATL